MAQEITISIPDVAYECVKQESERKKISMAEMTGIIINAWCIQQLIIGMRSEQKPRE